MFGYAWVVQREDVLVGIPPLQERRITLMCGRDLVNGAIEEFRDFYAHSLYIPLNVVAEV